MTFRATFHFDMPPAWEEAIKEGRKTVDVRINIQPYADVNKGDIIRYNSIEVIVKKIRAYPSISDLLTYEDFKRIDPDSKDLNDAYRRLIEIFHHDEPPHGLLALEIEPIEK
jgi:ASC-1-like (ASCH) protein